MEIILSAAVSLDGYIDDCSPDRLKLSGPEDWRAVEELRAECDAILVGAGTVRKDNPSLVIKRPDLRQRRLDRGLSADIDKVVVTNSGNLDPESKFFTEGNGEKLVVTSSAISGFSQELRERSQIITLASTDPSSLRDILLSRGYRKVLVEGGSHILSMFISEREFDIFRLAVAPFFVGDAKAPRLTLPELLPPGNNRRLHLIKTESAGDMSVSSYSPYSPQDETYLKMAVEQSLNSPPSPSCYRVGAVVVTSDGQVFSGYTHETSDKDHAEEEAVKKAEAAGADLRGASIYSSMEPCSARSSKPVSCSELIIKKGFSKVVFALPEPEYFVKCRGAELLEQNDIDVVIIKKMQDQVRKINSHLDKIYE